ncbi:hypothetical protein MHB42_13165 [Lysinibacillus sp. FSL K6-0232]
MIDQSHEDSSFFELFYITIMIFGSSPIDMLDCLVNSKHLGWR